MRLPLPSRNGSGRLWSLWDIMNTFNVSGCTALMVRLEFTQNFMGESVTALGGGSIPGGGPAVEDIREAGNCMAADCNTAAVFHLMRAVEWGLRALCVDLGFRKLKRRNSKTGEVRYTPIAYEDWDNILAGVLLSRHSRHQGDEGRVAQSRYAREA